MPDAGIVVERSGALHVIRGPGVSMGQIRDLLAQPGDTLKRNRKSHTRRVGDYVIKSSAGPAPIELVRHTIDRNRYRRGWDAANHLSRYGVCAPIPVAHVEWSFAGLIWRHATVTAFIDGCEDVERYYDKHLRDLAGPSEQAAYLDRLADAVNALIAAGAIHTDLAGKNILTRDGNTFYFIDLDGVLLNTPFDESRQLQLHVQLYDSFVDRCGDDLLLPFVAALQPREHGDFGSWMARVKAAQALRRARTVAAWKKEGK